MASYDADGKEAWVLDKGTYKIKVAHSVRDIEKTYSYTVPKTKVIKNDDKTGTKIQNLFDDTDEGLTVLSRADRKGTFPKKPTDFSMPESVANADQRPTTAVKGEAPKQGVTYEDGIILLADVAKDDSLWEKFLDQFDAVKETEVGYANGRTEAPSYEDVCYRDTGHAETVRVVYDETKLSTEDLLRYYFMTIDPTSVNRQGNDIGTQYRTGIWFDVGDVPEENRETLNSIKTVMDEVAEKVGSPLAVEFGPLDNFYTAEEYHQKYLDKHPFGYCHIPRKLMHLENT